MAITPVVFYGAVINPTSLTTYLASPCCLLAINDAGIIDWIIEDVEPHNLQDALASKGYIDIDVVTLKDGEFIIPGFVDTHTHAPQVPNMGTGGQYQLLDWLENVTYPTEGKFSDAEFAQKTYEAVVTSSINVGTTTCCYYATLHLDSTKILANIVHALGQRAFIGKCNMNREAPTHYVEPSAEASVEATSDIIRHIRAFPQHKSHCDHGQEPLVQPIITPRFAISCTDELLTSLGSLVATDSNLRIQTHISENLAEVDYTRSLFPAAPHYAGVYDMFGLLRNNTILAHAVHLSAEEIALIKARKAGISHCPTSNFNLSSGVAPVGVYLDKGLKVGLGTDVSGGFSNSMLSAIRNASIASKVCSFKPSTTVSLGGFSDRPLSIPTLFYLATLGGAEVCGLEKQVGSFVAGKSFDALLVNVRAEAGNAGLWGIHSGDEVGGTLKERKALLDGWLERFLFCGDDRNISKVYVQGRAIGGRLFR